MNQTAKILFQLALFVGLLVVVTVVGLFAGEWSVPKRAPLLEEVRLPAHNEPVPMPVAWSEEVDVTGTVTDLPPLYFSLAPTKAGDWGIGLEEVSTASAAGVHRYVLPIRFTWDSVGGVADGLTAAESIVEIDARASFLFRLDLNPSAAWLGAHAGEVVGEHYAKLGSEAWRESLGRQVVALQTSVGAGPLSGRVEGYVLAALSEGQWAYPAGVAREALDVAGFRVWLAAVYDDDAALAAAWGAPDVTLADATLSQRAPVGAEGAMFLPVSGRVREVDTLRYLSALTADTIGEFVRMLKEGLGAESRMLVPYGFTFEAARSDSGHFALGDLLLSEVDGFVSPVSYFDRGLGGVGGPMGPIDSARYHGKRWYLVDDTRTGMEFDAASGAMVRMRGVRAEDVFNVQRRNFGMALTHGLGMFWHDPDGAGWLHGAEQWAALGGMSAAYAAHGAGAVIAEPTLMVVVQEGARLYLQEGNTLGAEMIWKTRDAALGVGVSTQFALLRDVLDGRAPTASVYLFVNAFTLNPVERGLLHARLEEEKACAVWMYAPGFLSDEGGVASIGATTKMDVVGFGETTETGSVYALEGQWLKKGEKLGLQRETDPLFYIDDERADVLAHYQGTGKASVAIRFMEEGWSSVYVADPNLSASLLREILSILQLHLYLRSTIGAGDTVHVGDGLVQFHARRAGERVIDFGGRFDVSDLLDDKLGWPDKDSLNLPMRTGETRLLRLSPVAPPH